MDIEFDQKKDAANLAKHGVSLVLGALVLENPVGTAADGRHAYGEDRFNAFGLIQGRLFVCTYTLRGAAIRIISLRRASTQESRRWLT